MLFYSILFYSILFYSLLFSSLLFSYLILSYLILSYLILSYLIFEFGSIWGPQVLLTWPGLQPEAENPRQASDSAAGQWRRDTVGFEAS